MEKHIVINEEKMFREFSAKLEPSYTLCYPAQGEEVPAKTVADCIEKRSLTPLYEEDMFGEARWYYAREAVNRIMEGFKNKKYSSDQLDLFKESDQYRDLICSVIDHDDSDIEREVLRQTSFHVRVTVHSNYDAWEPIWSSRGLYANKDALTRMMSALRLNPWKVKQVAQKHTDCFGRWPNIRSRNGKEIVDYEAFVKCLVECPNYGLWTFFGKVDFDAMIKAEMNPDRLVIPKGTDCTVFNPWNGGGSLEFTETLRDTTLAELNAYVRSEYDRALVEPDEGHVTLGYCSASVYGGIISNKEIFTEK